MEGSGKWTEIFIKKNGSEHLLSPHSLFFLRSICGISFHGAGSSLKYFKRLGPAGPFLQPSSERGRPWMMIVCVWRFNWKTFPEVERRAEEMISPSLIFFPPTFSLVSLRWNSRQQRPLAVNLRTAGERELPAADDSWDERTNSGPWGHVSNLQQKMLSILSLGKLRVASSFCASLSTLCLQFIIQCGPTRASGLYQMHRRKPRELNSNLELLCSKRKTQLIVLLSTQIRVLRSEGYLGKYINVTILCSCYMTQHTNTIIIIVNTLKILNSLFKLPFLEKSFVYTNKYVTIEE